MNINFGDRVRTRHGGIPGLLPRIYLRVATGGGQMRKGYKELWERKTKKHLLQIEILRRTPTYQRVFDETFIQYLQFAYGSDADISTLKADPNVRTCFVKESLEGKLLASSMRLPTLIDADLSIKIPTIGYYQSTIRLIRSYAGDKPSSCINEPTPGKPPNSIMDTLRDGRYLSLEIDLQNSQEDIRAALDFWVFAVFWEGVNPQREKQPRSSALADEDLDIFDLKMRGRSVLKIMRERYPETKGKDPNIDSEAKKKYRRLHSRIKIVQGLIDQEDNRLMEFIKT
jgi:hypothetical protein